MSKDLTPNIRTILFDLGKVLLQFNFDPAFKKLSKISGYSQKDIEDYFVVSGIEALYDGGKISSYQFFLEIKKALSLKISFLGFKKIWGSIFTPKKEVIGLAKKLAKTHRLVLISNINELHFDHVQKRYPFIHLFDACILSYKERIRKPDERLYQKALRACKVRPDQVYYIDDRRDFTEAAKELGMHVFTYQNNFEQLVADLKTKGSLR